jgi:uncharacterized membrane protein YphA (DoxX/SURF4 family)
MSTSPPAETPATAVMALTLTSPALAMAPSSTAPATESVASSEMKAAEPRSIVGGSLPLAAANNAALSL